MKTLSTLFTATIVSSSDSFNVIIMTSFQMMISCIIGDIVAYAAFVIFFDHTWITIFVYLLFIFLTTGFLLSSKFLPWSISKRMYFEYFLLIYVIKPTSRSPIIFLKSGLASILTTMFVFIGCFIMNPFFSSELFLRTTVKIIHRSHQCTKTLGRQLEIKTMTEIRSPLQKRSHKKIINDIHSRLSKSATNIPTFFRDEQTAQQVSDKNSDTNSVDDGDQELPIKTKKKVKKYFSCFRSLRSSFRRKYNNITTKSNRNNYDLNLNISHITPSTLRKKKDIIENNSYEIINNYKEMLIKYNIKYSLNLNMLARYLRECRFEFWNKDLISHFKEISIYLEKNHNIINSMQVSIEKDLSNERCKFLLPLIPYINTIIHQTNNVSVIMENQIMGNYRVHKTRNKIKSIFKRLLNIKNSSNGNILDDNDSNGDEENQINEREVYKKTLEYSQIRVIKYFERVDDLIEELTNEYQRIEISKDLLEFDEESQCELSRIHFFLNLLCSYTVSQKRLSELIYSCSKSLYRQHKLYHFEMFILICYWFLNLPKYTWIQTKVFYRKLRDGTFFQKKPLGLLEPQFTFKEKFVLFIKSVLKRILFKWRFSIKFSIFISILSIGYYEITKNSNFILFRNSSWYVISFLYVSAPTIGASGFFCCMRFFGTLLGVFSAFTVGVFFALANHDGTKALCYVALTFFLIFVIHFFVRGKPIQSFGNFFILSYATITFPEYTEDHALIIITLLRWFHISLAVFTIMAVSYILPYYDHKELELNLLEIAAKELKAFKKIVNYHFDLNITEVENQIGQNNTNIINSMSHNSLIHCPHQTSIPEDISTCSSFYSADYFIKKLSIDRGTFKDILYPIFHNIRSNISQQRSLIFNSRFELLFHKKKYNHLKDLLASISTQYMVLVGLEFIILDNSFNNNSYDSYFVDQVRLRIIPKLKYIVSELDYCAESILEIKKLKKDNCKNRPVVFPINLKFLIDEVYNDYHSLVYCNSCDVEHSFSIHQLGCLLYTFDLFVTNHHLICHHIWSLSKAIKVERSDIETNYNPLKLVLETLKSNYSDFVSDNNSFLFNPTLDSYSNFEKKSKKSSSNNSSNSSSSSSSSSSGSSSSSDSEYSSDDEDIDMFIPFTRDLKTHDEYPRTNNRFNKQI
ncbi:hypothetical protein DICPUDRAFT_96919 [Dictyostelium purpureum]|uniref:Integral membrane bound transporter domain-containing protein n=1 Tax=Dictyostelium purpureum TaxID=5786 RepID=F0ZC98_DICPU|nr:uncharacterized protein DICPUDRAFT_96919 [Dictyostelium purpureum]EGC38484.1 hypothetical protein DICPUDRAFT_96919 [Dictyostelium purpureum]|eukprot:XP_003285042.1 hypothetical protein DICPUDRAFT_96919 [Dictyostelium purpureum]